MNRTKRTFGLVLLILAMAAFLFTQISPLLTQGPASAKRQTTKPYEPPFTHEADGQFLDSNGDVIAHFRVELAESAQDIQVGMMYRKSMAADMGRLFLMPSNQMQSFWMKNTYVSLDIIFLSADNRVVSIQADAAPLSAQSLPSTGPANKILELPAGTCANLGIEVGNLWSWERL